MLTLAIQSTQLNIEIVLFQGEKVIYEQSWQSQRDEIKKLLPAISAALEETHHQFSDLKRIVVGNGPGGFSATRIGVTIANSLGYATGALIYEISTEFYQKLATSSPITSNQHFKTTLAQVVLNYFASPQTAVPLSIPQYSSEAKITPSKKPKFV